MHAMYVQILALILMSLGIATALCRRNVFFVLMGVELALNAVNLSLVGFSKTFADTVSVTGQIIPLFTIAVAAAEACVGLAIIILIFRNQDSADVDNYSNMRG
ncbi:MULTISPECIES: NADH-quinone oxidoreductase subunit NuoK [Hallerella]|uniref:NADH-quinone oxidoreductase subunit K n=1 Tax=Hallerella succinigenes TaxID=1896222 RepID=A0A2M9A5W1_9BACT|nr:MULTISPECIES: NADH-quinone oxidoreductase subunit NuoK [Hallerella]MBS7392566.1 NADH-quinone oxidoreductase subunit NuoK [Fibrobacter sp.]MCI6872882.1 NADH-quinone oxidoreductase subunit NuoK [Hallerella sp.]MDY5028164.1 NADH-quinone oxidoreductase subunit NuoK [Hallerella succinigenes]PJJ41028.1 NADH:ubiquinone oxidoreductase subunit K [Hallerella succinigenes]